MRAPLLGLSTLAGALSSACLVTPQTDTAAPVPPDHLKPWVATGAAPSARGPLDWPAFGPDRGFFRVDEGMSRGDGLVNGLPDVIGPIDGSAKLTVFTEGNHYPVLLPLLFDGFPAYCVKTRRCDVAAEHIAVVTLPQVMIVAGLQQGGFRFGNAQLPVRPDTPFFPDVVMLGDTPMRRLRERGLLAKAPRVFARHRGLGLLIHESVQHRVTDLDSFVASRLPFVVATPREKGARDQYVRTMTALVGAAATEAVLAREQADFPGRLAIQHRDVPYAVINGIAPVGIIFSHLARFYAGHWPKELKLVEVPEAEPFGSEIYAAPMNRAEARSPTADAFLDFFFAAAPEAYLAGGFASSDQFELGRELSD